MAALYQAKGTDAHTAGTTCVPTWPTHVSGDLGLLCVESLAITDAAPSAPSGWTQMTGSPVESGGGSTRTRLSVFYRFAVSSSETDPTITNTGDHIYGIILTVRGVDTSTPFDVLSTQTKNTQSQSLSITGVTATEGLNNVLYIAASGLDSVGGVYSGASNSNLTGLVEITDAGTTDGGGGLIGAWTGTLLSPGASGTLTASITIFTIETYMVISFKKKRTPFSAIIN